tara:strand:+ start:29 stop:565 length:537 start_codon:yes stop_codon:yes gene_type:complete
MTAEYPLSGLMNPPENDALEQLKKEIYRDDKPYRTVQTRIGDLTPEERKQLVQVARIVLAFQRENVRGTGVSDIDYMGLIERLRQGLQLHLKVLLSDVLNEIEPVKVVAKEKAKPTGMSLYEDQRYFPKTPLPEYDLPIQQSVKDKPSDPKLFPQSDVQNNKGPNSAKGTNREEVIAS